MILFIIAGILFEILAIVAVVYFCIRHFKTLRTDNKIEVNVTGKTITSDIIRDGFKDAIKEMAYEEEQKKIFLKKQRTAENVYNSIPEDKPVKNSGGYLIPYGLSDDEKEALEMFFGQE